MLATIVDYSQNFCAYSSEANYINFKQMKCLNNIIKMKKRHLPINPIDLPSTNSPFKAPIDIYSSASSLQKRKKCNYLPTNEGLYLNS